MFLNRNSLEQQIIELKKDKERLTSQKWLSIKYVPEDELDARLEGINTSIEKLETIRRFRQESWLARFIWIIIDRIVGLVMPAVVFFFLVNFLPTNNDNMVTPPFDRFAVVSQSNAPTFIVPVSEE